MIEILWSFLNIVVLIAFIVICFKAVKVTREQLGLLAAVLLALGLFSFITSKQSKKESATPTFYLQNTSSTEAVPQQVYFSRVIMEQSAATTQELLLHYAVDHNRIQLQNASSLQQGLVMGTKWVTNKIDITPLNNQVHYQVWGKREWNVLGVTCYTQQKHYTGVVSLKQ